MAELEVAQQENSILQKRRKREAVIRDAKAHEDEAIVA
jgi:hypothetical protein